MSCLFCRIIEGSIPSKAVYQDDQCYAFADINPQAPVHLLIVPREHIASIAHASSKNTVPWSDIYIGSPLRLRAPKD